MALPGAIHMGHLMVMDLQGLRVGHTWDLPELNPGDPRECHLTADLRVLLEVLRVHPAEDPQAMALTRDLGR